MIMVMLFLLNVNSFVGSDDSGLSIFKVNSVIIFGLWLIVKSREGKFRKLSQVTAAYFTFCAWCIISYLWALDADHVTVLMLGVVPTMMVGYVLWDTLKTEKEVRWAIQALVSGIFAALFVTLATHQTNTGEFSDRASTSLLHPNELSYYVAMTIPFAWGLAITPNHKNILLRLSNWVQPIAVVLIQILTASRGGLVAAIPAFIFMLLVIKRKPVVAFAAVAVAIIGGLYAVQNLDLSKQVERLQTTLTSAESTGSGRTLVWSFAIDSFKKHPILGIGYGNFVVATSHAAVPKVYEAETGIVAHNEFLSVLAELGIIGFAIAGYAMYQLMRTLLKNRAWTLAAAGFASLMCLMIGIATNTADFRSNFWVICFLLACVAYAQHPKLEAPPKVDEQDPTLNQGNRELVAVPA